MTQHEKLAAQSPILALEETPAFIVGAKATADLQAEVKALEATLQAKTGELIAKLGIAPGQTSQTKGTLLFEVMRIRDLLLSRYRGKENELESWGFSVAVGTAKSPTKKKPSSVTGSA